MKSLQNLQKRLDELQKEKEALQETLAGLERDYASHQAELTRLMAQAERTGSPDASSAADRAESHQADLQKAVNRRRAALQAVEGEIVETRQALEAAQGQAKRDRLVAIRQAAGRLADKLDANLDQPGLWSELTGLYREQVDLLRQLYGDNSLLQGGEGQAQAWRDPVTGLAIRLDSITKTCFGLRLSTLAGAPPRVDEPTFTPISSLRQALRL